MDGALTGCQVLEGAAARLSNVRPALQSRGDGPDLAAGGPMNRIERRGVFETDTGAGNALTGQPSGSPGSRRPVTSAGSCAPRRGDRAPLHGFCPSHRGVGSFHQAAAIGHRDVGMRWDTQMSRSERRLKHGHEHAECGSCVCCQGISYVP